MSIQEIYTHLWEENLPLIEQNRIQADPMLNNLSEDSRRGMTLICRPDQKVQENISAFLNETIPYAPGQYRYPAENLHTTILSIITTGTPFDPKKIDSSSYNQIVRESLNDMPSFSINYKGITTSAGAVLIQGFPTDETLELIRDSLRKSFGESDLFATIDARYKLSTAHITCQRFQKDQLYNPQGFAELLKQYRNYDFGISKITQLELALNDWYMREEKKEILSKISLR